MTIFQRRKRDGQGTYLLNVDGTPQREAEFTIKFTWQGKPYVRKSGKTDRDAAQKVADKLLKELQENRLTDILTASRARADRTTAHLITDYLTAGCPDRDLRPRATRALEDETKNLAWITQYFGAKKPADVKPTDSTAYLAWRKARIAKHFSGRRTVELELQALANCFTWALRDGRIERRPELILKLRTAKTIRHARDMMPTCGDELHAIAARFFAPQRGCHDPGCTEVYGWLTLFLALTGLRIGEATQLLAAPKRVGLATPPGFIDETYLYVIREKRGRNPRVKLTDPDRPHLAPLLEMIHAWHAAKYPASPWLFPAATGAQLDTKPLTKALSRACKNLGIEHRTAHGLRAYYASTRLAAGVDVEDIARELGQRSGEDLVRCVYGLELDDFQADTYRALKDTYTWIPNTAGKLPAWTWWTDRTAANIITLKVANQ